jgi:hypothetical protein
MIPHDDLHPVSRPGEGRGGALAVAEVILPDGFGESDFLQKVPLTRPRTVPNEGPDEALLTISVSIYVSK